MLRKRKHAIATDHSAASDCTTNPAGVQGVPSCCGAAGLPSAMPDKNGFSSLAQLTPLLGYAYNHDGVIVVA